jgi:hypothetical protein
LGKLYYNGKDTSIWGKSNKKNSPRVVKNVTAEPSPCHKMEWNYAEDVYDAGVWVSDE